MRQQLQYYFLAQSFLTRIPIPKDTPYDPDNIGGSVLYYPLIGLLIGSVLAGLAGLFSAADSLLIATILTTIWILITGALHLDGLADSADGWLGGHGDKQRIFHIMQDARLGTAGVAAIVLILLFKVILLSLLIESKGYLAIMVTPMLARLAASGLLLHLTTAKKEGLAYAVKASLPHYMTFSLSLIGGIVFIFMPMVCTGIIIMLYLLKRMMQQYIGGITGDTLGATIEIIEVTGLLLVYLGYIYSI